MIICLPIHYPNVVVALPSTSTLFQLNSSSSPSSTYPAINPFHEFSVSGTASSIHDPLSNTGLEQSYFILPIKDENTTYSGIFTFTSSKPVKVESMNVMTVDNKLKLPIQFGTLYTLWINGKFVILSSLSDKPVDTGTFPLSGHALRVIANEPFLITYSFSGKRFQSTIDNNLTSALQVYKEITGTKS